MIRKGGIFNGHSGLGAIQGFGATGVACSSTNADLVRKIQTWLKANGAPLLKVDGSWQGCTASAWNKIRNSIAVSCDDIQQITGDTCNSETCFLGYVPTMTAAGVMTCTDGSDGARATVGGAIQCAPGQCTNILTNQCALADPLGVTCKPGTIVPAATTPGAETPAAGAACPAGYFGVQPYCAVNPLAPQPQAATCPSGTVMLNGQCVGASGTTQPTTPAGALTGTCPAGQFYVPLLGCMGTPTAGGATTPAGGAATPAGALTGTCPAGQFYVPLLGCMGTPTAGGATTPAGGTTPAGALTGTCPAGQMYVPLLGCMGNPLATTQPGGGAGISIPGLPGVSTTTGGGAYAAPPKSFFSQYWWEILGAVALGIGGVIYYRKKQAEGADLGAGDMWGGGYYNSNCDASPNRRRGRRRSRRRSRR